VSPRLCAARSLEQPPPRAVECDGGEECDEGEECDARAVECDEGEECNGGEECDEGEECDARAVARRRARLRATRSTHRG